MIFLTLLCILNSVLAELDSSLKWDKQLNSRNYHYITEPVNTTQIDRDGGHHGGVHSYTHVPKHYNKHGGSPIEKAVEKLEQQFLYLFTHTLGRK